MSVYDQGRVFLKEYLKKKLVGIHGQCYFVSIIYFGPLNIKWLETAILLLYGLYANSETYSRKMAELSWLLKYGMHLTSIDFVIFNQA